MYVFIVRKRSIERRIFIRIWGLTPINKWVKTSSVSALKCLILVEFLDSISRRQRLMPDWSFAAVIWSKHSALDTKDKTVTFHSRSHTMYKSLFDSSLFNGFYSTGYSFFFTTTTDRTWPSLHRTVRRYLCCVSSRATESLKFSYPTYSRSVTQSGGDTASLETTLGSPTAQINITLHPFSVEKVEP